MTPDQRRALIKRMAAHPRASIRAQAARMSAARLIVDDPHAATEPAEPGHVAEWFTRALFRSSRPSEPANHGLRMIDPPSPAATGGSVRPSRIGMEAAGPGWRAFAGFVDHMDDPPPS